MPDGPLVPLSSTHTRSTELGNVFLMLGVVLIPHLAKRLEIDPSGITTTAPEPEPEGN